jgi:hypothetical protein
MDGHFAMKDEHTLTDAPARRQANSKIPFLFSDVIGFTATSVVDVDN